MTRLTILTVIVFLLAVGLFLLRQRSSALTVRAPRPIDRGWLVGQRNPATPAADLRPPDQTFLTFPEWYLVFSPEEQADYFATRTASGFPYMSHVRQFWQSYGIVSDQIRDNFPYNRGYHFMIWVIGGSTTVEYMMKSAYESTIGRITDTGENLSDEDKFYGRFTRDYVDFIKDRPWYEFDFRSRLASLWRDTPIVGPHFLRSIERKYFITSELIAKALYGAMIKLGTKTVYSEALPSTVVVLDSLSGNCPSAPDAKARPDGSSLVSLPRYDRFAKAATDLARCDARFREVAGNTSAILLTVLVPREWECVMPEARELFTQPIITKPSTKRVAIATPVAELHTVLKELDRQGVRVEHVFDY